MELNEFRERLIDDVRYGVSQNAFFTRESFLNEVSSILMDAEVIDDAIEYVFFEGSGPRNKSICIDGYIYNELDENLCIYITHFDEYKESIETITQTVAYSMLKKAFHFITESKYIIENFEESSNVYELAYDIAGKYCNIKKYSVYLLTDSLMSRNIKYIDNDVYNSIPVEYHIIDINRLYEYSVTLNSRDELIINLDEYDDENSNGIECLYSSSSEDYTAYLCCVPGMMLAKIYNKFGSKILEGNVRSFLQTKGKVNKGIRNTILNNPEMFFAYNNGITVTASDVEIENINGANIIKKIKGLQIVNGGQTTASLGSALINDKKENSEEQIKKVFVPMKLSIVTQEKALELIPEISKYANSQNKVSDADLWSNHPFQRRMENFSRTVTAPAVNGHQYGTYWYYERAKGQYRQETYKYTKAAKKDFENRNPKNQMFTKTDLAKYMNIKLLNPYIACAGNQKSFVNFSNWLVKKWEKSPDEFNEQFYKEVIALAILYRQTDLLVSKSSWYTGSYKANIVIYTLSMIIYTVSSRYKEYDINYREIWNKQIISEEWINNIEKTAKIMYEFLTDSNRSVENVTEWAKRLACWEKAKSEIKIELTESFINKLVNVEEKNSLNKEAKKEQRETDKVNTLIAVYNLGSEFWKNFYQWCKNHKIFSEKEISILKIAVDIDKGKSISDTQSKILFRMLEKAKENGFNIK